MKSKTILLWGRENLLSSSVELFLTSQKGWKVFNISDEENFDALIEAVDRMNPNVVIIQQGERTGHLNLPTVLLQSHPGLKVIAVSLNDNMMEVYSKQDILISSAIAAITSIGSS